jgi:ribosomal protein S7
MNMTNKKSSKNSVVSPFFQPLQTKTKEETIKLLSEILQKNKPHGVFLLVQDEKNGEVQGIVTDMSKEMFRALEAALEHIWKNSHPNNEK